MDKEDSRVNGIIFHSYNQLSIITSAFNEKSEMLEKLFLRQKNVDLFQHK